MTADEEAFRIAILGSGTGTIARAIVDHEKRSNASPFTVATLITTRPEGGFHNVAVDHGVPCVTLEGRGQAAEDQLLQILHDSDVSLLVLAGYMRLLPTSVIRAMKGRVINTHPALLPKFGGKGMYGRRVHEAVLGAGERTTGATVHWVTEQYDEGAVIAQEALEIRKEDTVESLQERVKELERDLIVRTIREL